MKPISKMFLCSLSLMACLLMMGFGSPKIDLSSTTAYNESMQKVYGSVPDAEKEEFRRNFSAVMSEVEGFGENNMNEDDIFVLYEIYQRGFGEEGIKLLQPINGLTANEITQRGRAICEKKGLK